MPGTTTNFAIPYPTVTDYVTDGATAMRSLAERVDAVVPSGMRNMIINGDMAIDQRNNGTIVTGKTADFFDVDRFVCSPNATGIFSAQQTVNTSLAGSQLPAFTNSLGLTVTTAKAVVATSDVYGIRHRIEGFNTAHLGWGTASAKSVTLSFWVRSSITGIYSVGFFNASANRSYVANYTIGSASTWEYKTITLTGDITGTWARGNTVGIEIFWDLGSGSTYETTAGAWTAGIFIRTSTSTRWISNAGATFYMTGAQLEVGSVATPFEQNPVSVNLALCQRYYEQAGQNCLLCKQSNTTLIGNVYFQVPKRTSSPVCTYIDGSGAGLDYPGINGLTVTGATFAGAVSAVSVRGNVTISSNSANNTAYFINENQVPFVNVSAEL
jgi:hypothetical protein